MENSLYGRGEIAKALAMTEEAAASCRRAMEQDARAYGALPQEARGLADAEGHEVYVKWLDRTLKLLEEAAMSCRGGIDAAEAVDAHPEILHAQFC